MNLISKTQSDIIVKLNDFGCFCIATHMGDSQVWVHHPHLLITQLGLAGGDSGLVRFKISRVGTGLVMHWHFWASSKDAKNIPARQPDPGKLGCEARGGPTTPQTSNIENTA